MRCRRCQKEISGVGKPAVPPVVPALIALVGVIYGLWSLTLGQDPSNALPHWSPVTGWGVSLAAVTLAAVLVWIGLARRKCPECGSTQMFDAMEEEGLVASERLALQKAAADQTRIELGAAAHGDSRGDPREAIEAELRTSHAKETADKLAAHEKELRAILAAEHAKQSADSERVLRKRLETELRSEIEAKLRPEIEKQVRTALQAQAAAKPVTPPPITTAKAIASSVAPPAATPTPVLHPLPRVGTPAAATVTKATQPATPHAKVETAPLSLLSSRITARPPAPAPSLHAPSHQAPSGVAARSSDHPPPGEPPAREPASSQAAPDGHERAKRRARVILSDMSLYHREMLLRAARAADAKAELGMLWRDALISYNEAIPPDIRAATNYLEEELKRQLAELRQAPLPDRG
jgi:hypothetical protein